MVQAPYDPPPNSSASKSEKTDTDSSASVTKKGAAKPAALTPMMAQYFEIKAVNPGFLLFYRMGDFYELFFEDAEIASQALGIVLTKRGKHQDQDIAMCGVPVHAAQDYLKKLIALGHRVAICEQMEPPAEAKKRGAKSVVKRDVVRLVTAGTITEDDLLPARANNFLASLAMIRHGETDFALAWADISTGETWITDLDANQVGDEISRIDPAELILSEVTKSALAEQAVLPPGLAENITVLDTGEFDSEAAIERLVEAFEGIDPTSFTRTGRAALGALVGYIANAQKTGAVILRQPASENTNSQMAIDAATRTSLELLVTNRGAAKGSLRNAIDMTATAAGSRLLARRLATPLTNPVQINDRLDMVETCVSDTMFRSQLRQGLRTVPDISRALTRLALERGGPRDLANIGAAITAAMTLGSKTLGQKITQQSELPKGLEELAANLNELPADLAKELDAAMDDEPPHLARDGGFVREGFDAALDKERALARESRKVIAALQARLVAETDIKALKIKHNNVLGYFVEVPAAHGSKLISDPHDKHFIHRQTMANAMRFTTAELAELEGQIARAHSATLEIELDIFARLRDGVLNHTELLRKAADTLAELDVTVALANLAAERNYCRPRVDASLAFTIEGGRHPVVEQTLAAIGESFVVNNCDLSGEPDDGGQLWLVTGPNMGGKSTFLRQNALIAILAQIGAYVPASSAHIGVVDRVFSRVGASDDIAQGRSTFMVEMVETAAILNRATKNSLVILDEIGRGTATFDGLSIAWATAEALHETNKCRALFATHFHELTSLSKTLSRTSNHTMKVREWEGDVVFLHEVADGAADRSYGIQVARLAGLPEAVLARARAVLTLLEQQPSGTGGPVLDDLPLFTHRPPPEPKANSPALDMLDEVRPDDLTPLEAIELVYQLKKARDADRRS